MLIDLKKKKYVRMLRTPTILDSPFSKTDLLRKINMGNKWEKKEQRVKKNKNNNNKSNGAYAAR